MKKTQDKHREIEDLKLRIERLEMTFNSHRPNRSGRPWTEEEERQLREDICSEVDRLAIKHERSSVAIWYRIREIIRKGVVF